MATSSVPSLNMSSGWAESARTETHNSIEMGMSGMNLLSSLGNASTEFTGNNSDGTSKFIEETMNLHYEQPHRRTNTDSGDSVNSQRSNTSTASPSSNPAAKGVGRSIGGPAISVPPPIDGGSEFHNAGRQSSPFQGGKDELDLPSRITTTVGDGVEGGFHGLRERANTAPVPLGYSSSPPLRGPFHEGGVSGGEQPMPRTVSRDGSGRAVSSSSRPPLAGSSYSQEFGTAPGIISRPGYGQHAAENDPVLRRSTSDTGKESLGYAGGAEYKHLSHKFGSLPTLSSQLNQQRMNPNQQAYQTLPRHQRSQSQPVSASYGHFQEEELSYMGGNDFGGGSAILPHNDYSMQQDSRYRNHPGDGSSRVNLHRRSLPQQVPSGVAGYYGSQSHPNMHRRDMDSNFGTGHSYPDSAPIIASGDELRMYMTSDYDRNRNERLVSPGHSPLHTHYGSHARHHSDSFTSSPGVVRGMTGQSRDMYRQGNHRRTLPLEDDLSHPLVGENIEVPEADHSYMMTGSHSHPSMIRSSSSSGRGGPVDAVPPHYGAETSHHLPTAGAALPTPKAVYNVKFKRTQRNFVIGPRLNRNLKIGTYVKVEADRGEDLGIVVGNVAPEKQGKSSFRGEMGVVSSASGMGGGGNADLKRIIRLATHDEVSLLSLKRDEEEELLKICCTKVRQRSLPMNVVDAEYQFDRHKLTFFFEAEGRVDFRELVRDLFSMYKTRIWMQQLDKNTSAACHAAVNPPPPVAMDYGTPIIAPVSEFREFVTGGEILDGAERDATQTE